MVAKIVFNMVDVSAPQFFIRACSSYHTRGHCHKLVFNYSCIDVRNYFLSEGIAKKWNGLAAQPQDFASLHDLVRATQNYSTQVGY